jgi:hypothetical protein
MTGLLAYIALVVAVSAFTLGHQGQTFPPLIWWRFLRRRTSWARGHGCARLLARAKRRTTRDFREAA